MAMDADRPNPVTPRHRAAGLVSSLTSQSLLLLLSLLPSSFSSFPCDDHSLSLLLLSSRFAAVSSSIRSPNPKKRKFRDGYPPPPNPMHGAHVDHFKLSYRMSSSTFEWLCGLLDPLLDPSGPTVNLPGPVRLAVALSRLAAGEPYGSVANRFGIPEHAARACVRRLCRVLCTNFRFWITFPSDLRALTDDFHSLAGLPGCCGAIACTRFRSHAGGSVAVQIVSDASSRILNIVAGFRGERSDFAVLKCSSLHRDCEAGKLLGSKHYLVGSGNYHLLQWLMVPFNKQEGFSSNKQQFNAAHMAMCRPVRRVMASLKNWGIIVRLGEAEDASGVSAAAVIGTCALLHNALLMREDYSALAEGEELATDGHGEDSTAENLEVDSKWLVLRSSLADIARNSVGTS